MNITPPTININGTSAAELLELNLAAHEALVKAVEAMRKATPHGRDYPTRPEDYRKARDEFHRELAKVIEAKAYMMAIVEYVYDQKSLMDENRRKEMGV